AEDGIRDFHVTGVQTCALPICRNGKSSKQIRTSDGTIEIDTPRDRRSNFDPQLIKKREKILADSLEKKILGMYGLGMSLRDISRSEERRVGKESRSRCGAVKG